MEATADNTRFLCTRTATDYDIKAIDIPVGRNKNNNKTTNN